MPELARRTTHAREWTPAARRARQACAFRPRPPGGPWCCRHAARGSLAAGIADQCAQRSRRGRACRRRRRGTAPRAGAWPRQAGRARPGTRPRPRRTAAPPRRAAAGRTRCSRARRPGSRGRAAAAAAPARAAGTRPPRRPPPRRPRRRWAAPHTWRPHPPWVTFFTECMLRALCTFWCLIYVHLLCTSTQAGSRHSPL